MGVVGVVGVVVAGGVVAVVVAGAVVDVAGTEVEGLRLRAAAATLLSLTVAVLAESGVALATAAAAVLLAAAVSELSPPPQALNTALDAKQINNALLSFIIFYELRKRLETSRKKSTRLDVFRRSVISAETNTCMLRTAVNAINAIKPC